MNVRILTEIILPNKTLHPDKSIDIPEAVITKLASKVERLNNSELSLWQWLFWKQTNYSDHHQSCPALGSGKRHTVKPLLGHSSVTVTQRVYAHLLQGTLRSASEVMTNTLEAARAAVAPTGV